jgi:cobalt-zinc-cadmium efflux system membrane fusion protein
MRRIGILVCCTFILSVALTGCDSGKEEPKSEPQKPSKIEVKPAGEASLTTITLTPAAELRLGVKTAEAVYGKVQSYYSVAGEVIVPPGQVFVINAPVAGSVTLSEAGLPDIGSRVKTGQILFRIKPLLPVERDLRVNAEANFTAATTRVEAAKERAERAVLLLRDGVGSVRAREDADEALRLAETELEAARSKLEQIENTPVSTDVTIAIPTPHRGILRDVYIAEGQIVSAGTLLYEVAEFDPVWIRAPIYSGEVGSMEQKRNAIVRPLNARAGREGRAAIPVAAPPSADPLSGTTNLFYKLANPDLALRPGELVRVSIPRSGRDECLQVPYKAILYDINGGTWVYEKTGDHAFTRRRVAVAGISGDTACLSEGAESGTIVVTDGAAELFGAEFGAGK